MLFIDDSAEIIGGFQLAFHQKVRLAFIDQSHCLGGGFCIVLYIIDMFFRHFDADLCADFQDLFLIADQQWFNDPFFHSSFHCAEGMIIIGCRNSDFCRGDHAFILFDDLF